VKLLALVMAAGITTAQPLLAEAEVHDSQKQECVRFGRQATLIGRVAEESRLGPPGYGENPQTDEVMTIFVMVLDRPVCIHPRGSGHDIADVRRIQIAGDLGLTRAGDLVGRRAVATGMLFEVNTGYHYTSVLIDISRNRPPSALDAER
jgi:hypothetical protein